MRAAMHDVECIERALKELGELPWSAQELLEQELDKAHPDVRSKQVVEHRGKSYQRHWVPIERDEDGLVSRWQDYWVELETDSP